MAKRRLSDDEKPNPCFMCEADYLQTEIADHPKVSSQDENVFNEIVENSMETNLEPISEYVKQIIQAAQRREQAYHEHIKKGQQYERLKEKGLQHKKFKSDK